MAEYDGKTAPRVRHARATRRNDRALKKGFSRGKNVSLKIQLLCESKNASAKRSLHGCKKTLGTGALCGKNGATNLRAPHGNNAPNLWLRHGKKSLNNAKSTLTIAMVCLVVIMNFAVPPAAFAAYSLPGDKPLSGAGGTTFNGLSRAVWSSWDNKAFSLKGSGSEKYAYRPEAVSGKTTYDSFGKNLSSTYTKEFEDYCNNVLGQGITAGNKYVFKVGNNTDYTGSGKPSISAEGDFGIWIYNLRYYAPGGEVYWLDCKETVTKVDVGRGKNGNLDSWAYVALSQAATPSLAIVNVREVHVKYEYFYHGTSKHFDDFATNMTFDDIDDHQYIGFPKSNSHKIFAAKNAKLDFYNLSDHYVFYCPYDGNVPGGDPRYAAGVAWSGNSVTLVFGNAEVDEVVKGDYMHVGMSSYAMDAPPDIPDIVKRVTDSDEGGVAENTLINRDESYTYEVIQDVPAGLSPEDEFTSFNITDQIDTCLIVDHVWVTESGHGTTANWRPASGQDAGDDWTISIAGTNLVTASAKATTLKKAAFYGGSSRDMSRKTLHIHCMIDQSLPLSVLKAHGHLSDPYTVVINNKAHRYVKAVWGDDDSSSNMTTTAAFLPHKEVEDRDEKSSESNRLSNASETFYYSVTQRAPAKGADDAKYTGFGFTDHVESCLGVSSVKVYRDGSTDVTAQFVDTTSGNSVRVDAKPDYIASAGFYGHSYTLKIAAKIRQEVTVKTLREHGHYMTDGGTPDGALKFKNMGYAVINGHPVATNEVDTTVPVPDLAIEKTVDRYENMVGDAFKYTIKVSHTNLSRGDATNVHIWDSDLTPGITISGITVSGISSANKSVMATAGGFDLRADVLKRSETAVVTFYASADKERNGQLINNTAYLASYSDTGGDRDLPKSDSAQVYINSPKLLIQKDSDKTMYEQGESIDYTLELRQINPGTFMREVVITDIITVAGIRLERGTIQVTNSLGKVITQDCDITINGNAFTIRTGKNLAYEDHVIPPRDEGVMPYNGMQTESFITVTYSARIGKDFPKATTIVNIATAPPTLNTNGDTIKDDPDIPSGGDETTHRVNVPGGSPLHTERTTEPGITIITQPGITVTTQRVPTKPAVDITTKPGVKHKPTDKNSPKTADGFDPVRVGILMACAGGLTIVMMLKRRKT